MRKLSGLDDEAWAKIEPHLPRGSRGARPVDDRRVISGIIHMLQSGARRRDCPAEYGPYTTIYNRFDRWGRQGVWQDVFKALAGLGGVYSSTAVDSTSIKAHRSAAGAKGWPRVLLPSPGNLADISMAHDLVDAAGSFRKLLAEKGYRRVAHDTTIEQTPSSPASSSQPSSATGSNGPGPRSPISLHRRIVTYSAPSPP